MNKTYYAIDEKCPDCEPAYGVLYLTPADYWHEQECQADWTDPEAIQEIEKAGFYAGELMEGTIEIRLKEVDRLAAFLKAHPDFENHPAFVVFMLNR
jgi:hypothetical protein